MDARLLNQCLVSHIFTVAALSPTGFAEEVLLGTSGESTGLQKSGMPVAPLELEWISRQEV